MSEAVLQAPGNTARARRNVAVLVTAHAILGAQIPMLFLIGGLAGQMLAPNICLATLPVTMIVFGSMLSSRPVSTFMQRHGRRAGFIAGAAGGAAGAALGAYGLFTQSFTLLLAGSFISGFYVATQALYQFAAADTAPDDFRPKAISYVVAGGLVAAIIGTQVAKLANFALPTPFLGAYLTIVLINIAGAGIFLLLDIPLPPRDGEDGGVARNRWQLLRTPTIAVAIICATVSYALMSLVMTSTPLAVVGCGYGEAAAADVVMAHVLAMFGPAFFTGHLINRFGAEKIVATGLLILSAAGAVALSGVDLSRFFVALILLGVGWNFGFIGATAMLSGAHTPEERGRVQGMNNMIVFGVVTVASLSSGGLMNCAGGDVVQGWAAVNLAMAPFLALAGGALIWLTVRGRAEAR